MNNTDYRAIHDLVIQITNDKYGNPRYYVSAVELGELLDTPYKDLIANRRAYGLKLYAGHQFGTGFVLSSYNLEAEVRKVADKIAQEQAKAESRKQSLG